MSWLCTFCTFAGNREESLVCEVCLQERNPSTGWKCNVCTHNENSAEEVLCKVCHSSRNPLGDFSDDVRKKSNAASESHLIKCPICEDGFSVGSSEVVYLESCEHVFCRNCIKRYIDARVEQGETTHILCPYAKMNKAAGGCGNMKGLTQNELRNIIGGESYAALDRRALERVVAIDPSLHLCTTSDCPYVVSWSGPEDGVPRVDCPVCCTSRCLVCGVSPYHTGRICAPVSDQNDMDFINSPYASSNIKRCRRCGVGIIKDLGCHKVMCRCGYRFCWECGSENAQCQCTPANHGFIDNVTGRAVFSNLRDVQSPS